MHVTLALITDPAIIEAMAQALIFDVFGTCVDGRTSVARHVTEALSGIDPLAFADAWRGEYQPAMERIRTGSRGYVPLDDLHLENLRITLNRFGAECSDPEDLNRARERLTPWPDTVPGLVAQKKHRIIAPCSNGSIALMTRLAKHAGLPWDCILGADIARDYKPKASVYLASAAALRLDPSEVVMVAAHNDDLFAARAAGLKTAFVARPTEHGPEQTTDLEPASNWDWIANDFQDLAEQMT